LCERITWQYTVFIAFIAIGLCSWGILWWAFSSQPLQVPIDLTNPLVTQGTLGNDPEGVWLTGNTQVVVNRFVDTSVAGIAVAVAAGIGSAVIGAITAWITAIDCGGKFSVAGSPSIDAYHSSSSAVRYPKSYLPCRW
jgi:hypothetical protein